MNTTVTICSESQIKYYTTEKTPQNKIRTRYKQYTDYGHQAIQKKTSTLKKKDGKPTNIQTRNT